MSIRNDEHGNQIRDGHLADGTPCEVLIYPGTGLAEVRYMEGDGTATAESATAQWWDDDAERNIVRVDRTGEEIDVTPARE